MLPQECDLNIVGIEKPRLNPDNPNYNQATKHHLSVGVQLMVR